MAYDTLVPTKVDKPSWGSYRKVIIYLNIIMLKDLRKW